MSDLVEFLRARLDEDEAIARAHQFPLEWLARPDMTGQPIMAGGWRVATCAESVMPHIARHDPARVLREVEAKRRIVWLYEGGDAYERSVMEGAIESMAAVYSDHPDYRDEWKP